MINLWIPLCCPSYLISLCLMLTTKSEAEVTNFIHNAVLSGDFDKDDLADLNTHQENQRLDKALSEASLWAQFFELSVNILVPSGDPSVPPKIFTIPGLLHWKLTSIIHDAFHDPLAHLLHYLPFKLFYCNPIMKEEEQLHSELYTSDAFHNEHEKLQQHGKLPSDDLNCRCKKILQLWWSLPMQPIWQTLVTQKHGQYTSCSGTSPSIFGLCQIWVLCTILHISHL